MIEDRSYDPNLEPFLEASSCDLRIYLCPRDDSIFCIVSEEDYAWCQQWRWQFVWDRWKTKKYACRSTTLAGGGREKLYLHKEILKRKGDIPPTPKHTIGDHNDSDSLNNRRDNLEYVTPKQNAERKRSKRWRHLSANDNHATQTQKAA